MQKLNRISIAESNNYSKLSRALLLLLVARFLTMTIFVTKQGNKKVKKASMVTSAAKTTEFCIKVAISLKKFILKKKRRNEQYSSAYFLFQRFKDKVKKHLGLQPELGNASGLRLDWINSQRFLFIWKKIDLIFS